MLSRSFLRVNEGLFPLSNFFRLSSSSEICRTLFARELELNFHNAHFSLIPMREKVNLECRKNINIMAGVNRRLILLQHLRLVISIFYWRRTRKRICLQKKTVCGKKVQKIVQCLGQRSYVVRS